MLHDPVQQRQARWILQKTPKNEDSHAIEPFDPTVLFLRRMERQATQERVWDGHQTVLVRSTAVVSRLYIHFVGLRGAPVYNDVRKQPCVTARAVPSQGEADGRKNIMLAAEVWVVHLLLPGVHNSAVRRHADHRFRYFRTLSVPARERSQELDVKFTHASVRVVVESTYLLFEV